MLEVKGKVRQVGSVIDGGFVLNSQGYEKEDFKDIDKSNKIGINVTVYPNVSYTQRDASGNRIYVNGINPKRTGIAVKTGVSYADTDRTRDSEGKLNILKNAEAESVVQKFIMDKQGPCRFREADRLQYSDPA